jgi:phenylalanyl-tRNA synthetase alpha chain
MNLKIDVTAPGKKTEKGNLHILTKAVRDIENIFTRLGFEIASGPEVESEFFNFDAMNVPENHPARDMQDTFFIKNVENAVLRTHTSGVQARYMQGKTPPIRIIVPGRVFRNESTDATHEAQFHQTEGLMVGENISLANLKSVLISFLREFFENENLKLRIRPGYFPFVEPGIEVDMTCHKCGDSPEKTCNVCKGSG